MPRDRWPATLPPVAQLLAEGLDLGAMTILVGENGAGKSTIVEGIATAFGLNPEGGSTGAMHRTRESESDLGAHLQLVREAGGPKSGFFLRAETMHGFFTYLEQNRGKRPEPVFHERSHGESFLDFVIDRSEWPGLWVLDEPESALSFQGCLALIGLMEHILEVGPWGLRETAWRDLDLVRTWRSFLESPERFLRHLT
jgi:predicted ATPase